MVHAATFEQFLPLIVIGGVLLFFGTIVGVIIIVKRHVSALQIKKDDLTEEEAIEQELDRILVPVDDEEAAKAMAKENIEEMKKEDAKKHQE